MNFNHIGQKIKLLLPLPITILSFIAARLYFEPATLVFRVTTLAFVFVGCLIGILGYFILEKKTLSTQFSLFFSVLTICSFTYSFAQLEYCKYLVRTTHPEIIKKLGNHFIVGYTSIDELKEFIRLNAIRGIFLTARNVHNKTVSQIQTEIESLQTIRREMNLPPLIITADQEGGLVSRLSPLLPYQNSLASLVDGKNNQEQEQLAFEYGFIQGQGLKSIGVNVNLSPVVDLIPKTTSPDDKHSLIHRRAMSNDPHKVSTIALHYILGLEKAGVTGTLKHFPGLGQTYGDSHLQEITLHREIADLMKHDWIPFQQIPKQSSPFIMVGHVKMPNIDSDLPASLSKTIIQNHIRGDLQFQGILMTDDLNMKAVYDLESNHLRNAGTTAINAGIDLLLVSFDERQFYFVMAGLIEAMKENRLNGSLLDASEKRLAELHF